MADFGLRIEGAEEALRALRVLEPTVAREVGREVSAVGSRLAVEVKSIAPAAPPVSGWTQTSGTRGSRNGAGWPAWSSIQSSSRRRGMSTIVTTTSRDASIASFAESLGRGEQWKTQAGLNLVRYARLRWGPIVKAGKKEGRVARAAVAENYPQIMADLQAAVNKAVTEVNRRMP